MATLNLSVPEELKSYIKEKASEMNTTVSEIFVDYVKQIRDHEKTENKDGLLSDKQEEKIEIAKTLAGSIKFDDEVIKTDDIRLNQIVEKHLNDE